MQGQAWGLFFPDADPIVLGTLGGANLPFPPDSTAEAAFTANDQSDQPPGGELLHSISFDMNSWSSTLEGTFADMTQSEMIVDAGIQGPIEHIDQLEHPTNNNLTDPTIPGASASSELAMSEAPPTHSDTVPMIRPAHQSYVCSWHHQGSDTQCNHVAPDRSAFLRHLGKMHQVSGAPDVSIVCQLLDSEIASACNTPIQRGSFPRHVDTHYPVRYYCQHCDKSFSRKDSWRKHIRTAHPQAPPAS